MSNSVKVCLALKLEDLKLFPMNKDIDGNGHFLWRRRLQRRGRRKWRRRV